MGLGEFLTRALKPLFNVRRFLRPGRQVVCRFRELGLDVALLPHEPIPLRARIHQLSLSGGLPFSGLLQAVLGFGPLARLGGDLLGDPAQVLAGTGCLLEGLLELAAHISEFLRPGHDGLLRGGNLLSQGGQALLRPRQLVLKIREALALGFDVAVDLTGSLLGGLHGLLHDRSLRLGLITGLSDLSQLLLGRLVGLLQGCELSLNLITRLRGLSHLFLSARDLGLQVTLLLVDLGPQLTLLPFEGGLFRRKPIARRREGRETVLNNTALLGQPVPLGA